MEKTGTYYLPRSSVVRALTLAVANAGSVSSPACRSSNAHFPTFLETALLLNLA